MDRSMVLDVFARTRIGSSLVIHYLYQRRSEITRKFSNKYSHVFTRIGVRSQSFLTNVSEQHDQVQISTSVEKYSIDGEPIEKILSPTTWLKQGEDLARP